MTAAAFNVCCCLSWRRHPVARVLTVAGSMLACLLLLLTAQASARKARCAHHSTTAALIRGRVVNLDRKPVRDAVVSPAVVSRVHTRTNSQGRFCLVATRSTRQIFVSHTKYTTVGARLRRWHGGVRPVLVILRDLRPQHVDPPAPDLANVITLGMSMDGANADMNVLNSYSRLVGRQPAVLNSFQDWQTSSFDSNRMSALTARGITPMITWEPWAAGGGSLQLDFTLRSIIRGRHDAYIHQWARSSAAWNHTYYLRFAHEMNDNSYPWAASTNTNTAARYIQAWQHVHDIFVADGATKVLWVWAPAKEYAGTTPLASVYPGSAYVDLIGLDAYNGGTALWGHSWDSLLALVSPTYNDLIALDPTKQIWLTETSSAETGGDKGAWIQQAFLRDIPRIFTNIKGVIWFNNNKEADWRVNSSAGSLDAFREVVASPLYH